MISPFNQAQDLFFDPILGKQFEYDHISKKVTNVSAYNDSSDHDVYVIILLFFFFFFEFKYNLTHSLIMMVVTIFIYYF